MNEAIKFLEDVAGYTEKEMPEWFAILDLENEWEIRARRWLDGVSLGKIRQAIAAKGGSYRQDEKTRFAVFTLPKQPSEQSQATYKEAGNEITTVPLSTLLPPAFRVRVKLETELLELVESIKTYGVLEPIIVRPKGNLYEIVVGERRVKAAKTAGLTEIPTIVKSLTDEKACVIQLTENFQRKDLTEEEKSMALADLAKRFKWNAQRIADEIKMSYSFVVKYLPKDFKDKEFVELGKLGAEAKAEAVATRRVAESEVARQQKPTFSMESVQEQMASEIIQCEVCGQPTHRSKLKIVAGKLTCPKCLGIKPQPEQKLAPTPFKPKEKPEFRRAAMQPQKSKFELAVIQELQAEGLPLETDQEFCVQKTVPDAVLKLKDRTVAIYIDNVATHEEGDETDEFLRSRLELLYGCKICVVQYKNDSAEERQRAKETIKEFLRW